LEEVARELESPGLWNDPEKAQILGKEKVQLEAVVNVIVTLEKE
jgi:peptide chain release factor 2